MLSIVDLAHLEVTRAKYLVSVDCGTIMFSIATVLLNVIKVLALSFLSDSFGRGEPGLVDSVLALHAGSRGFDSHRGHMSERFFRSNI